MGGSEKTVKNKIDTNCYKSEYIYISCTSSLGVGTYYYAVETIVIERSAVTRQMLGSWFALDISGEMFRDILYKSKNISLHFECLLKSCLTRVIQVSWETQVSKVFSEKR